MFSNLELTDDQRDAIAAGTELLLAIFRRQEVTVPEGWTEAGPDVFYNDAQRESMRAFSHPDEEVVRVVSGVANELDVGNALPGLDVYRFVFVER
jgi:hypothetical protein